MTPSQPPPASPDSAPPAVNKYQATQAARANEPPELRYARQTRNATVFIAVLAGVVAVVVIIGVILAAVQLASVANDLNGLTATITNSALG